MPKSLKLTSRGLTFSSQRVAAVRDDLTCKYARVVSPFNTNAQFHLKAMTSRNTCRRRYVITTIQSVKLASKQVVANKHKALVIYRLNRRKK